MVDQKLVDDQGINSPRILASLSDKDITTICEEIRRPSGLIGGKMPDRGNQIFILAAKNLKLAAFMFKTMECCSRTSDIRSVCSTSVLKYQHQWKLEQKKPVNIEAPKVSKNKWEKTTENIMLYLKIVTGVRGVPRAYVVW